MQLSRKYLDAYNAAIKKQGTSAEQAAKKALIAWFIDNPQPSVADARDFGIELMNQIGEFYGNKAGDAAYALRDVMASAMGVELPDIDYVYKPGKEYVEDAAHYQAGKLANGDSEGFKNGIADASRYFAERGANDTMTALGKADAKKLGKKVRFARIPTGVTTCSYCCMLASRGFVYHTELSALNANHKHCDCRIVEGFEGIDVEGYDPKEYYDRWKHPEKYLEEQTQDTKPFNSLVDRQFNGVSSIEEASKRAESFVNVGAYKSKIDMKGMNIEAANSMLKALDAVYSSYDVEPLRSIQRMNKRSNTFKNTTADAAYQWTLGDLYYNADHVKTTKAMAAHRKQSQELLDEVLSGDLSKLKAKYESNTSKVRYIEALERTGRATVSQSFDNFEEVVYAHELGHMLDDRLFRKSNFDRNASFEQYAGGISGYATTSVKEYIAESFSAFYAGETANLDPNLVNLFREMMK